MAISNLKFSGYLANKENFKIDFVFMFHILRAFLTDPYQRIKKHYGVFMILGVWLMVRNTLLIKLNSLNCQ